MANIGKIIVFHMVQKLGRTKKVIKVGKISGKYDILTVEEKWIALIGKRLKEAFKWLHRKDI